MTDLLHAPVDKARERLSSVILLRASKRVDDRLRDLSWRWPVRDLATPPAGSGLKPIPGDTGLPLVGHILDYIRFGSEFSRAQYEGRWVKATPAFNRELCARFGVEPINFDGERDALLHTYTGDGTQHMEYLHDRGMFDDLPLAEILDALCTHYGDFIDRPPAASDAFTI